MFELSKHDFKQISTCRREVKLLKQLWDYMFLVRTCIDDWRTTLWSNIDVENMDMECKKFAKVRCYAFDVAMRLYYHLKMSMIPQHSLTQNDLGY